jgi:steroid delta-isomerase-like uncharacterized protein
MTTEQNKAVLQRVFDEIFNGNNMAAVDELIDNAYVYRRPGRLDSHGPEMYKRLLGAFRAAFPDCHFTVEHMIAEGDDVFTHWRLMGTHRGDYMGVAPTGKRVIADGMVLSRCNQGRIVEELELMDELSIMRQLGVVATPGQ